MRIGWRHMLVYTLPRPSVEVRSDRNSRAQKIGRKGGEKTEIDALVKG